MDFVKNKRVYLAIGASIGFVAALLLALKLLSISKFTGSEFVAFVLSFAALSLIVGFAPEVQEFSIAGNVVKLREVKNDALRSIDILKKTQIELLRMMLRARVPLVNESRNYDPNHRAIDSDFWKIVEEARRINALPYIRDDLLVAIEGMFSHLYQACVRWGGPWRPAFVEHNSIAEASAELLNPEKLSATSRDLHEDDESLFKNFVLARLAEVEELYGLKREISKLSTPE